jgi:hypothetical protein
MGTHAIKKPRILWMFDLSVKPLFPNCKNRQVGEVVVWMLVEK